MGAQDAYAEAHSKHESDLVKRMFKHVSPGTEIVVVDAQTSSIVKTTPNIAAAYPPHSPIPAREQAIQKALPAIAAAHAAAPPPARTSSLPAAAAVPASPVVADNPALAKTNAEFDEFEKELEAGIAGDANKA